MTATLLLKLLLVPCLIGCLTLAGHRWGPAVAGWLSAFPVLAAPILFFLTLEQGVAFAAAAAAGTLIAVPAILVFGVSYAWAATRYSWGPSLAIAFVFYGVAVAFLRLWHPAVLVEALAVVIALVIVGYLFPAPPPSVPSGAKSNDVVWRMIAAAALVVVVTRFSPQLGPTLSGMLAMFPVMLAILAVCSHRVSGAGFAIRLIRGAVLGYYAFGTFCLTLSLTLSPMGIVAAFTVSLASAAAVQLASRTIVTRMRAAPATK